MNSINIPPPKIVEIPAFMGSCRGSKWQSFFQDTVVNSALHRPSYGLTEVSATSVSIQLDRQRSKSEMANIASLVQDKINPKPVAKPSPSNAFSTSTNVGTTGDYTSNATGGIGNASYTIPNEIKVVRYFCSDFSIK